MKKSKQSTGLTVITQDSFTVENIPMLLKKVTDGIKEIKGVEDDEATTAGKNLPGFGMLEYINDVGTLVRAYSSVEGKDEYYKKAAKKMGLVKFPPLKIDGVGEQAWKEAIIRRERVVSSAKRLAKLEEAKAILTERLSEEDKMKNACSSIVDIFEDL